MGLLFRLAYATIGWKKTQTPEGFLRQAPAFSIFFIFKKEDILLILKIYFFISKVQDFFLFLWSAVLSRVYVN